MLAPEDRELEVLNPLRRESAERLMLRSIDRSRIDNIQFLLAIHYRDEPELDEAGQPLLRRDTPLHRAFQLERSERTINHLFRIYSANYASESGLTHFHVACRYGFRPEVERFLEEGQDPNCPGPEGNSPLHYAVAHLDVIDLLLARGARPNVANLEGLTPLQLAAESLRPLTVDALLDHGADLSSFVFPTEAYCRNVELIAQAEFLTTYRALKLIEVVETGKYRLSLEDAWRIMRVLVDTRALETAARSEGQLQWQTERGQILSRRLTLQQALNEQDVESRLALVAECFPRLDLEYDEFAAGYEATPITRACLAAARILFRRWTAEVLYCLCHARLPVLVCYLICGNLSNEDMLNMFQAAMP